MNCDICIGIGIGYWVKTHVAPGVVIVWIFSLVLVSSTFAGEVLYNGIELPDDWPPHYDPPTREPMAVPYLDDPPVIIPIDVGRQLFVDDFLIEKTNLSRTYHRPTYHAANPILRADQPWELETNVPGAAPFSDGVFFDPADQLFKMWYIAPIFQHTCYATSADGITWEKPALNVVAGTNIALPADAAANGRYRDSCTIWLDHRAADPTRRFVMFNMVSIPRAWSLTLRHSPDGIDWSEPAATSEQTLGDRTTAFYNPFRRKWVASVRVGYPDVGRARAYMEDDDPVALVNRAPQGATPWTSADREDPRHPDPQFNAIDPQLYNLDAAPYESLMLGLFSVWEGPPNRVCAEQGIHKRNEVLMGFSRDGFHWHRPDRRPFLGVNDDDEDAWNRGNVQSVGGGCVVVGDKLYFYVSGRAKSDKFWDANIQTGVGVLRRDGFASMDTHSQGQLTTRPVTFQGSRLFVNVDAAAGELRAEVLDEQGEVIEPFTRDNCVPLSADTTLAEVRWNGAADLAKLTGRPVKLRFHLTRARLFAFWVSPDASGASHGYVAAGGPGFKSDRDTVGMNAYKAGAGATKAP